MLHAERLEERALGRTAGARDDFDAEMMRDLDRRHADAAGARVNEDRLAFAHARDVLDRMPCRHENDWQRRGFLKREAAGNFMHVAATGDGLRGQAEDG